MKRSIYSGIVILVLASIAAVSAQGEFISVDKTATPSSGTIGTNITFNIEITNVGTAPMDAVTLEDVLPAGITFKNADPFPNSIQENPDGSTTLTWALTGSIPADNTSPVIVRGWINGEVFGELTNAVTATARSIIEGQSQTATDSDVATVNVKRININMESTTFGEHYAQSIGTGTAANSVKIKEMQNA
jgi:uncharacterized repeat protein (TIGR01451 family)